MTISAPARGQTDRDSKTRVVELRDVSADAAPVVDRREATPAAILPGKTPASAVRRRGGLRTMLMLGGVALAALGAGWFWISGGRYISSDDAYLEAAKEMVSTDVSGLVRSVNVSEGQKVAKGQQLFQIDPQQFQIALAGAQANLAQTRVTIAAAMEDYKRLQSDIGAESAQVQLDQSNYDRAAALLRTSAGTKAAYDQTRFALAAAEQTRASLLEQAQVAQIRLGGRADLPIERQPQYLQAKAQVDEAQRELDHATVRAPFSGLVTGVDALQPGTYLVSQTAALTNTGAVGLVSDTKVWATANMKETDLTYAKVGDPATVTVDAYPGRVWSGRVATIYPATGSQFSILPAQNSSGNWVKVVQRVPLRVTLDVQPGDPPLRAGMSVTAVIDTGHRRQWSDLWKGWLPAAGASVKPGSAPDVARVN